MPRLGWHRAVGPQESAWITHDLDCSPIFRANGAPPSQPGHRPNMALQGQRPGVILPWASPQEMDSKRYLAPTARPIRNAADVPACGMMDRAVGPWWLLGMVFWGVG